MSRLAEHDKSIAMPSLESGPPLPDGDNLADASRTRPDSDLVLEDLLVEDVSIDGMCGVY